MLSEKDICQDTLKDLKYMSTVETLFAGEASPDVKHLFLDQVRAHQDLHTQFLRLMESRNWYPRVAGDWAYAEPYTLTGTPAAYGQRAGWQAPVQPGAVQQGVPAGATWQASQAGAWQAPAEAWQATQGSGGTLGTPQAFQALQQNLRDQR